VLLQLHLLRNGPAPIQDPAQQRMLAVLERNVGRMKALIHEMLDVARLQAGRLALKPTAVDLVDVLRGTLDDFALVAQARRIDLHLQAPARIPMHADRQRLEQVVSNLVSNAVRVTPSGGSVNVLVTVLDAEAVVRVKDTGIGLTAEQAGRLFQPFTRVHEEVQQGAGTGLGLYISQGLAGQMGGRLWAESAGAGQGATFSFALPLAPPPGTPPQASADPLGLPAKA
jgi:signal transduction histidine kinase